MERLPQNSYNERWFKERALSSLKKVDEKTWDYSDSLLLYPPEDKGYEEIQNKETPYNQLVTKPERAYLEHIAPQIAERLPSEFDYIDLGPGTEHKEQSLFDALHAKQKGFTYIPVDINERFLELAAKHAKDQGIEVRAVQTTFEELVTKLPESRVPRFVSLGLTYTNYHPREILPLLRSIAGNDGYVFINSQMRDRVDMAKIAKIYGEDAKFITDTKLGLLGLKTDDANNETNEGVQIWSELKNSTPQLEAKGILPGTRLLLFQSLRTTPEALERDLAEAHQDHELLDTGEPFVGTLLKPLK